MRLDPAWLVAAAPRGIVCVRGGREVVLGLHAPFDALVSVLRALEAGADVDAVAAAAGTSAEEARRAVGTLREQGVLGEPPSRSGELPAEGMALVEAVVRADAGEAVACGAWTADELLVLPDGAGPAVARTAVRAFVAGLSPDSRLEAYAAVATYGRRSVAGDVPDASAVAVALAAARAADPTAVHVVALADGRRSSVSVDELGRLGMGSPHRLGPLQRVHQLAPGPPLANRRATFVAEYAVGNLAGPWPVAFRVGRGTARSARTAELVARAEAAERYGAYEVDRGRLRTAAACELDAAAVTPDRLQVFSARQHAEHSDLVPYDAERKLRWTRGVMRRGEARWVPADAVHVGLSEPDAPPAVVSSSSGLAAGATAADAADRALRELIERDAFMWTWVQRVSRERLDPAELPAEGVAMTRAIEALGYRVSLVNLTLDTKPVVMAVLHSDERVHVAAACREDPREAAVKALDETALVLAIEHPRDPPALRPQDVDTPEDHMWLHLRPEGVARAEFLWASTDLIGFEEVAARPGPVAEAVETVGEAVFVDLTSPRTAPFHVVRALVPGLVPISFGWDRETLALPRLSRPAQTVDGRRLGQALDLANGPPILPHPFP